MSKSIETYGLEPPRIAFTDNLSDRPMLEHHFPSLKEGVQPISTYDDFPVLHLPSDIMPKICSTTTQINDAILSIIDNFSTFDSDTMVVGLDTEWDVDIMARREGIPDRRKTAIMQLAYDNDVWIFQLKEHISNKSFPAQLITFLANPQIIKVGRNVLLDLKYLQEDSTSSIAFVGGIDLAHRAKEKGIINDARASLSDLCIKVLSAVLPKDFNMRVNAEWSGDLNQDQIQYAALDAWASLKIYQKLENIRVPVSIDFTSNVPAGTKVFIYQQDRTNIIAHGTISPDIISNYQGVNITKTRILVQVVHVYVPGAIMSLHQNQPITSFGPVPFNIVCRKTQLKTYVPNFIPIKSHNTTNVQNQMIDESDIINPLAELISEDNSNIHGVNLDLENLNIGFNEINSGPEIAADINLAHHAIDHPALNDYKALLHSLTAVPWPPEIRSGVLKDIFHVFHMIYIPKSHGLRVTFSQALRDAIFLPDLEDKKRIISYLACRNPPLTWDECLRSNPKFIKKHCKHVVPPPEQLYNLVSTVFKIYGPLKDAQSGLPLFSSNTWKTIKNILYTIKRGEISDPPGIAFYYCLGTSSNGLPHYRCWRGTNFTEGAVHRPIRKSMPFSGVSPRHTVNRLKDFVYRHNMLVCLCLVSFVLFLY